MSRSDLLPLSGLQMFVLRRVPEAFSSLREYQKLGYFRAEVLVTYRNSLME
jgi:hypothetical protein